MTEVKNTCYECGTDIPANLHFCDTRCGKKYVERYGKDKFRRVLGRQTRLRKRLGMPHFTAVEEPEECGISAVARSILPAS